MDVAPAHAISVNVTNRMLKSADRLTVTSSRDDHRFENICLVTPLVTLQQINAEPAWQAFGGEGKGSFMRERNLINATSSVRTNTQLSIFTSSRLFAPNILHNFCFSFLLGIAAVPREIACVASVSVWFRSKERLRNGILGFGRARNETSAKKGKWREREGVSFLSSPPSLRSFTCAIFRTVFDSHSSFFAPRPHGNAWGGGEGGGLILIG